MMEPTVKSFSLLSCDWIGFDLDHTLIRYRLHELHRLMYNSMRDYLIEECEYNSCLYDVPYDDYFAVKALIYDSLYGNLIQLDSNGSVHTALHGLRRVLSLENLKEFYPSQFENIEEDTSRRFLCIFTYFEHSISYLIANLVDLIDENKIYEKTSTKKIISNEDKYKYFLNDLLNGFDYLFNDYNRGNYFASIRANPEKYIYKRHDVQKWLEKLKISNRKLFLATNSRYDYTNLLSTYALGSNWQNLFDLIILDCKKPSFFLSATKQPFHKFDANDPNNSLPVSTEDIIQNFSSNNMYLFGNSHDLHTIFGKLSMKNDPIVIYFGDHIKSDINALKRHTTWLAAVVIEELEFDSPPTIINATHHHITNETPNNEGNYHRGNRSKYFSSFFTSPSNAIIFNNNDQVKQPIGSQTEPDALLPCLSSYWYIYITKHAHLSLSCLSVLANNFDLDYQFKHEKNIQHLVLLHKNLQTKK